MFLFSNIQTSFLGEISDITEKETSSSYVESINFRESVLI